MLTHPTQSLWLPALSIISPQLPAISALFPMHGIYLWIHFLIRSVSLYLFPFTFMSLCDLSVYNSVSIMSSHPPCPYISTLIPVSICTTLIFPTHIYKPHMSCMSPQFVYQLQPDYYCQSSTRVRLKSLTSQLGCSMGMGMHGLGMGCNVSTHKPLGFLWVFPRVPMGWWCSVDWVLMYWSWGTICAVCSAMLPPYITGSHHINQLQFPYTITQPLHAHCLLASPLPPTGLHPTVLR